MELDEAITEAEDSAAEEKPGTNGHRPEEGSVLAEVRRRREQIASDKTLDLLVPGYEGRIAVRYRGIPIERWEETIKRTERSNNPMAGADALVETCETILVRNAEGTLVPIGEEAGIEDAAEAPVCFDSRLGEILGFEANTARKTVMALFSPDDSQLLAPAAHLQAVSLWLQGSAEKIDEDLLDF